MNPQEIPVGVVGLGLMGCSIVTCLLIAGHPVVGIAPVAADLDHAEKRIKGHLDGALEHGLLQHDTEYYLGRLLITQDYSALHSSQIVIESTLEDLKIKEDVLKKAEAAIASDAILASNTSAIPISTLQRFTTHPERFFGLHWSEPAHTSRFLEVICGEKSNASLADYLYEIGHQWAKEPILVRKDIPGFITNRLMYAMYREAIYLVENGYATVEDVDRSCRNNAGFFMTLVGIFRWMDLTGVPAYHKVMKDLLPTLNNSTEIPKLIDDIVKAGGQGVANGQGFYDYEPGEAKLWQETFAAFTYEIREIALKYPADVVKQKLKELGAN
jgi:3-hydroxybutyryl-CoA dehydrogenase